VQSLGCPTHHSEPADAVKLIQIPMLTEAVQPIFFEPKRSEAGKALPQALVL
jgi:hypothetical protein